MRNDIQDYDKVWLYERSYPRWDLALECVQYSPDLRRVVIEASKEWYEQSGLANKYGPSIGEYTESFPSDIEGETIDRHWHLIYIDLDKHPDLGAAYGWQFNEENCELGCKNKPAFPGRVIEFEMGNGPDYIGITMTKEQVELQIAVLQRVAKKFEDKEEGTVVFHSFSGTIVAEKDRARPVS